MHPKRISVKFFAADPAAEVDLHPFIGIFHSFIQEQKVEGLLVDVADYAHVPEGPGVMLIGHDVDYAIDSTGGRTGLLVTRKHFGHDVPLPYPLRDTLRMAAGMMSAIEAHPDTDLSFSTEGIEVALPDRLTCPNTPKGVAAARAALEGPLQEVFGAGVRLVRDESGDARAMLTLVVEGAEALDAATLLERVGATIGGIRSESGAANRTVDEPQSEWDVSVEEVKRLRDRGADFVLLDVRESVEREVCTLDGKHIPLGELSERMDELPRDAYIVVHCKGGGRSAKATELLRQAGFENAWNMNGGIIAWIDRIDASLERY